MSNTGFLSGIRSATKRLRAQNNWTQGDLGDIIGVSCQTVSGFENGISLLREDAFDKLMGMLQSPDSLVAFELRNLAEFMENPTFSKELKEKRFKAFLECYSPYLNLFGSSEK